MFILIGFVLVEIYVLLSAMEKDTDALTRSCSSRTTRLYYTISNAQFTCRRGVTKQQRGAEERPVQNNEPISSRCDRCLESS
jgi:hypothetical protein